ncbi:family 20 glycosylhydrolase [Mucilaginibacter sp. McL0603]|uniref:family 20 glycosylhydrolase n=1 Tax=Mucilaginibacter sp. McL0603 TaxID=3415670 RepID=UPI003CFB8CFA
MYKNIALVLFIFLLLFDFTANAQDADLNMGIIPAPVSVKKTSGEFVLSQQTVLLTDSMGNKAVAFFTDYLQHKLMLRNELKVNSTETIANSIVFTEKGTEGLPDQGYRLTITPQQIIVAGKGAGLFYGIQTLLQLIPADRTASIKLPCARIEDYPRFGYRGLMLDVCRHFFSVEFIKKTIDLMAYYKLNNFHWHLTDDQGWRIEIKKYPRLTEIGSQRAQTVIGNYHDRTPQQFDNTPYGGFYTQDQIREVVKYAADRYINVVPEIEMPGHSMAALAAYPELSCDPSKTYKVYETWGVVHDVYCPSDKTFSFLEDVLTEVMDLFPSKYIHVGGDEVPKDAWKNSAFCQKMIKKLKLKNEEGLQSYFIQRIEKFVNSKGRSIIGWDEILEGGLSPNATVMSWRGENGGIAAAKQSHNVIMTPGSGGLYLDHSQGKVNEPLSIGGYYPLQKTYSYNPTPDVLTPEQQKYVIGVQANLWSEYISTDAKAEYMLYPRLLALSEIAWTPLANKNFKDFSETRLPSRLAWLDKNNYDYHVPTAIGTLQDTIIFGSQLSVNLKPSVTGAKIFYTIDSYSPRETDLQYRMPITYDVPQDQYRDLQTIVITPSGKRSQVTHTIIYNKAPLAPVSYQGSATGLKFQLFQGSFANTGQFKDAAVVDSGVAKSFNPLLLKKNNPAFGVIYTGYIRIDADGLYQFSTRSDDGSVLAIDDQPIVNNDGKHPIAEQGGAIALQKGYHKFTLKYFDSGSISALRVYMTVPGKPKGELSPDSLYN